MTKEKKVRKSNGKLIAIIVGGLVIVVAVVVACIFLLGNDPLKGTWKGTDEDGYATWEFQGGDKCVLTTPYGLELEGTCKVKDGDMEVKMDAWGGSKTYHFTIDGKKLTMKADDPYSPNYELTKQ